jgi:hypothetical protein
MRLAGSFTMPYLYAVRCNFTRPDLEPSFNAWYSVEKIAQLLAKPMFRAVQRFRLVQGNGRGYLALWQVDGPAAFDTPQYKADWGFAQWRDHIADWNRDLFDATATDGSALAVPAGGALVVTTCDGMTAQAAQALRATLMPAGTMWFASAGLDRATPLLGLRSFSEAAAAQAALPQPAPAGVQIGIYHPLNAFAVARVQAAS